MSVLFVDTTYDISLGILDDECRWVEFRRHIGQRASILLQKEANQLFQDHGIVPHELKAVVTVAGPGFYTGLRLSEGLADVFEFFGIPHYSFLSYELPFLCGHKQGVWFTKAYRGEYFFHHWEGLNLKSVLVPAKDLVTYLADLDEVFIHSESALDEMSLTFIKKFVSTNELIKNQPRKIFAEVLQNKSKRESFYFRAPEDEFRVST